MNLDLSGKTVIVISNLQLTPEDMKDLARVLKQACGVAANQNKPLIDIVKNLTGDALNSGSVDWLALARPENYLGGTARIIDAVLREAKKVIEP